MMQEDYVSFEVAKLLKEKGFDGEWHKHYWGYFPGKEFLTEGLFNPEYDYPAPTLQMAMKWLRETHGIHIVIHPSSGVYYGKYCLSIYVQRVKNKDFHLTYQTHEDTYEKVVEEGISYSLISLVK